MLLPETLLDGLLVREQECKRCKVPESLPMRHRAIAATAAAAAAAAAAVAAVAAVAAAVAPRVLRRVPAGHVQLPVLRVVAGLA